MVSSTTARPVRRLTGNDASMLEDVVATEEPLEIRLQHPRAAPHGKSISITMRTPGHDAELALGFFYSENIIGSPAEVSSVRSVSDSVVIVELDVATRPDLAALQRHFYTTSSCGVCGKSSLQALEVHRPPADAFAPLSFAGSMLRCLPARLRNAQPLFEQTGGLHAAALFRPDGTIVRVAEDVGRHNAVDKLVGALLRDDSLPASGHGLLVSGRASFELMQKAVRAGIPLLAAVGAPSSLAVDVAQRFDLTLIGFLRHDRFNIYSGVERVS